MRVVTTYPPKDRDIYVERNIATWNRYLDGNAEIQVYTEEPEKPIVGVDSFRLMDCGKLKGFLRSIEQFGPAWGQFGKTYDYNYNAGKFCRKVFEQYEAAQNYEGLLVWLDADVEALQPVDEKVLSRALGNAPVALYQRPNYHSECGIMLWRLPEALPMFEALRNLYVTGQIFRFARGWHDCWAWDLVIEYMEVRAENLSPVVSQGDLEVINRSQLGAYFRHDKGNLKYKGE